MHNWKKRKISVDAILFLLLCTACLIAAGFIFVHLGKGLVYLDEHFMGAVFKIIGGANFIAAGGVLLYAIRHRKEF